MANYLRPFGALTRWLQKRLENRHGARQVVGKSYKPARRRFGAASRVLKHKTVICKFVQFNELRASGILDESNRRALGRDLARPLLYVLISDESGGEKRRSGWNRRSLSTTRRYLLQTQLPLASGGKECGPRLGRVAARKLPQIFPAWMGRKGFPLPCGPFFFSSIWPPLSVRRQRLTVGDL